MNHDVILDRYARLFELPEGLSATSEVSAVCLDYRLASRADVPQDLSMRWRAINLPRNLLIGWIFQLLSHARRFKPSVVIASSDCLCVIVGYWIARVTAARFIADLYDDYSAFGMARIPGLRTLYRRALTAADGLVAVSQTLAADSRRDYSDTPVLLLESTIDTGQFHPLDTEKSRSALGLSRLEGKSLVGVCGGLNAFHGADIVFRAIKSMAESNPEVEFILAGKPHEDCPLPSTGNVTYLGMLPHQQMAHFYSAMDVQIVALSNSKFGYYAFPQKAYEVLACRVPVVAADVGALAMLFEDLPEALYDPDSPDSLVDKIRYQLEQRRLLEVEIPTWSDQAARLAEFIEKLG